MKRLILVGILLSVAACKKKAPAVPVPPPTPPPVVQTPAAEPPPVVSKPKPQPKPKLKLKPKQKQKPKPKLESGAPAGSADGIEILGKVTAPSGKLAIFDIGLFGFLPREALEPAIIVVDVPPDRPLAVVGQRLGNGRFKANWDHVSVVLDDGVIASTRKLGEAGVDFARLILMDAAALDHWRHEDSLDGRADFVFWGRDAGTLAKVMRAPASDEGHGWTDLPVAEAEAKADQAARLKAANHWLLATDLRPHSHHFHALAAARASARGAGTIEVGGAQVLLFFTSWGDGVFPVFVDSDANNRPVRIRVQLSTPASNAAMRAVNR